MAKFIIEAPDQLELELGDLMFGGALDELPSSIIVEYSPTKEPYRTIEIRDYESMDEVSEAVLMRGWTPKEGE